MLKASDLHNVWAAPDNSRLTSKQFSFRLPAHVAAKLAALCDMYPERTRTQLVGDLLSSALEELERGFPAAKGKPFGDAPHTGEKLFEDAGPGARYRALSNRYYREIEKELGNEKPRDLYTSAVVVTEKELEGG